MGRLPQKDSEWGLQESNQSDDHINEWKQQTFESNQSQSYQMEGDQEDIN